MVLYKQQVCVCYQVPLTLTHVVMSFDIQLTW